MKNFDSMTVLIRFNTKLIVILDSGLLFGATLYILHFT